MLEGVSGYYARAMCVGYINILVPVGKKGDPDIIPFFNVSPCCALGISKYTLTGAVAGHKGI